MPCRTEPNANASKEPGEWPRSVYIDQLKDHVGQEVTLQGWLYNSRASGKIQFLIVRDGTGLCQCIVEKGNVPDEVFERAQAAGAGVLAGRDRHRPGR